VTDIALKYPERISKMVLVAPGLLGSDKFVKMDSVSRPALDTLDAVFKGSDTIRQAEVFTEVWCVGPFRKSGDVNKTARDYIFNTTLRNLRIHANDYWPRFSNTQAAEYIGTIKVPVLIIAGEKDIPFINNSCKFLKAGIGNSKQITIPNVAHMLNMEQAAAFNKALLSFL
jgi:pimeloyl-ACP methyl ester carboxylesterase